MVLVPMRIGGLRFLLLDDSLDDIGAIIHWIGLLGRTDDYYVEARCDQPPRKFELNGPEAPPRSQLPDALKRFVFANPVEAHIIGLVDDSRGYHYDEDDPEFLVRIDKGSKDMFRLNMPLCSPRTTGQQWKGWVADTRANSSEVRIVIEEPERGEPFVFPAIGQVLTTSADECEAP